LEVELLTDINNSGGNAPSALLHGAAAGFRCRINRECRRL